MPCRPVYVKGRGCPAIRASLAVMAQIKLHSGARLHSHEIREAFFEAEGASSSNRSSSFSRLPQPVGETLRKMPHDQLMIVMTDNHDKKEPIIGQSARWDAEALTAGGVNVFWNERKD